MQGPYRTRLVPPETFPAYWNALEAKRRLQKRLRRIALVVAIAPALSVPISTALAGAETAAQAPLERAVVTPMTEPFGLAVNDAGARALTRALPPGVPRPDLEAGVTVANVQAAIEAQGGARLASCFRDAQRRDPALAGDVVVSVAVGVDRAPMAVVRGNAAVRAALESCLVRVFEHVRYPRPRHEAHWFHYPVTFSARLP